MIDIHSHFFSLPFFEALAGEDAAEKLARLTEQTGIELPPEDVAQHLARWTKDLDRHGVDHLVTFASVPEEAAAVAAAVKQAEGRISGCALVNPLARGAADRVRLLVEGGGLAGVLLFPAMHHFRIQGKEAAQVFAILSEHGGLVFVHCGLLVVKLRDLLGLPRPYDLSFANPLDLIPAANAARGAHFIIPHFGAGFFREALMAGTQCENIYVDTSSSNSWMKIEGLTLRNVFSRALDAFGPERILFGTDSNVFPAGWRRDRYEEQKACLDDLAVSAEDQEKIFHDNAARLLGL